jgi:branched-chain amino acid transport system permease protein
MGSARSVLDHRGVRIGLGAIVYLVVVHLLWPLKPGVVVQGVIIGGLTALIAFGIALVYRANRIVNFAQGDLGAVPATLAVLLIVGPRWPFIAAAPAGIAAALVLGFLVDRLVIRRFANAPRLILTVATIGLAQVLAGVGLILPNLFDLTVGPQSYPAPFDLTFRIDPITFNGNDVLAIGVIPLVVVGLAALLRSTNLGVAIRASAESGDRASLLGINVGRVRTSVWMLAAVLATVAMILRAGVVGLPIGNVLGPAILLRALAAAVIGRMERLPTILVASIGLGIIESAIVFSSDGLLVGPITFLVLLGALAVQHRDRLTRFVEASTWRAIAEVRPIPKELAGLPEVKWGRRIGAALLIGGGLLLPVVLNDGDTNRAGAVLILGIVAISLVVLCGWAGQVSLGQVAFLGVGAAIGGAATANLGWDISVAFLCAGGAGAAIAVVVGIPALRVSGLQLAVATLAFAIAVHSWFLNRDYQGWLPTQRIPRTPLLGRIDLTSETRYFYLCLAVFIAVAAMAHGLRSARAGRVLIAMRENERAAQTYGVNATRTKLTAFAFSGFFAALGGALFVHHQQSLGLSAYAPEQSLRAFATVIIGGLGSLPGALLGATFVQSIDWIGDVMPSDIEAFFTFLGTGIGTLFVLMVFPGGLGTLLYRVRDAGLRRIAARRRIAVPSLVSAVHVAPRSAPGVAPRSALGEDLAPKEPLPARRRRSRPANALLRVEGLEVSYDRVQVLFGIDLDVGPGEVVAVLGTNGAGKTTLLRAISGLVAVQAGHIHLDGEDITGAQPHEIARLGVAHSPGDGSVFPSLTVREHLKIAGRNVTSPQDPLRLFEELRDRLDTRAGDLSGGEQQMLTLAMSFIDPPKVLMIDELSLGLAPTLVDRLLDAVRVMRDAGTAIVLVEQSVNVALTAADRAYFIEKGEVRYEGPAAKLVEHPELLRSVFLEGAVPGRRRRASTVKAEATRRADGKPVLELAGISRSFGRIVAVDDVSLTVGPGEIVGVIGPNGAGKTTLFDIVSGFLPPDAGEVILGGRPITHLSPDERARAGLGRSFQDARLFGGLTVAETIAVSLDREIDVRDPLAMALHLEAAAASERDTTERVDALISLMRLDAYRDSFVGELSTGTRRIVDLACALGHHPSVILLDEPSAGIAQRESEALAPLLLRLRDETGAALVVIEHDVPLVTKISDRMIALDLGRLVAEGTPRDVVRDPAVVASYLGRAPERPARRPRAKAKADVKAGR